MPNDYLERNHDRVRWWTNFISRCAAVILAVWFVLDFTRPNSSVTLAAGAITIISFIDYIMEIFLWSEKKYGEKSLLKWFLPVCAIIGVSLFSFGILFLAEAIPYG